MGAYSQLRISRAKAMERLAEHRFSGISNAELEEWFNHILGDRLYTVAVSYGDGEDDAHPAIEGIG